MLMDLSPILYIVFGKAVKGSKYNSHVLNEQLKAQERFPFSFSVPDTLVWTI